MPNPNFTPDQKVIAAISNSISSMLGRGSRAAMREAGKAASHDLWPALPENVSRDEIPKIMHEGVRSLNGFGEFHISPNSDDTYTIAFQKCGFSAFTEASGEPCGQQPICFFGFGLVEETLRRLTGKKFQVALTERDDQTETCHEIATPR